MSSQLKYSSGATWPSGQVLIMTMPWDDELCSTSSHEVMRIGIATAGRLVFLYDRIDTRLLLMAGPTQSDRRAPGAGAK